VHTSIITGKNKNEMIRVAKTVDLFPGEAINPGQPIGLKGRK